MNGIFLTIDFTDSIFFIRELAKVVNLALGGFILYWIISQWNKAINHKFETKYTPIFKELIDEHIYSNSKLYLSNIEHIDLPLGEFKIYDLRLRRVRCVLVKTILECLTQFPGEKKKLLKKLYLDLDLELYTIMELNILKGDALASAIKELSDMDIIMEEYKIVQFLEHKNPAVRKTARIYIQKLFDANWNQYEEPIVAENVSQLKIVEEEFV